jgi:protein-tyrosine phosphatase
MFLMFLFRSCLAFVALGLVVSSCGRDRPDIWVACETNVKTGCTCIKWEVFPEMEGRVRIYESLRPDSFNLLLPVRETDIADGCQDVFSLRSLGRTYYRLVFDDRYSVVTAERVVGLEGPFNFRDVGGYYNEGKRQVRWGMVYRSSSLSMVTGGDVVALDNLGIRTVIDLRTEVEQAGFPCGYGAKRVFSIPLLGNPNGPRFWFDRILSGEIGKDDVVSYLSVVNLFFLENNSDCFRRLFDVLLDEGNYPVVLNCMHGNDRTGVAVALILFALGVDWNQVLDDWLLSDRLMDYYSINGIGNPELYQDFVLETLTAMFREPEETFTGPFGKVVSDYGSIERFLEVECGLTAERRARLRGLLLYP